MLKSLTVKNFALVGKAELEFGDRLNILSGETGAGKSIIVDCLMLLSGGRYDRTMLRYGENSGFVEGVFSLPEVLPPALSDYAEEGEGEMIITRRFSSDGKSEIRINGRSATLSMLKNVAAHLIEICGQNEHQSLADVSNHIKIVDYYARHSTAEIKAFLSEKYAEYRKIVRELDEIGDASSRARALDVYKFQLDEIDRAAVKEGEEEELVAKRKRCLGAEKICAALSAALTALTEGETSAAELLGEAESALGSVAAFDPRFAEWAERIKSAAIEAGDIADSVAEELDGFEFSQEELDGLEKRLDTIRSVTRKYGSYEAIAAFRRELVGKIDLIENAEERYEKLSREKREIVAGLYDASAKLSELRRRAAEELRGAVERELGELGMENSAFEVRFSTLPAADECERALSANGMDEVEFYLSPNVGQPMLPLVKIISGGELSRLMLALKTVSSSVDDVPTVIFDEIDAGISGRVGREIAKKLALISRDRQLLCVTHLPQIAAMADEHYFIDKYAEAGQTYTRVTLLDRAARVEEVARLSGSKDISTESTENASQMIKWSDDYKLTL